MADESRTATLFSRTVRDRFDVIRRHVESGSVLDIGCVDARPRREGSTLRIDRKPDLLFRRLVETNPDTLGVDIDAEGVALLAEQGFRTQCADAGTMSLGRRFDTIVAGEVIEHVADVGRFLANLADHLEPSGTCIISTPNPFSAGQIWKIWRHGRPQVHEDHTAWLDPITISEALRRAGLELFEGYWVQPRKPLLKSWQRLFRSYFSHSFIVMARRLGE